MLTYIVAFLLSATCAFGLTPLVRRVAVAQGLFDAPSARKVHVRPVPRIGGVAIAVAFFVPVVGLSFLDNKISAAYLADVGQIVGLVVGSILVVLLGLADDIYELRAMPKFAGQVVVAVFAYAVGYQIIAVANPFGDPIVLGFLSVPVTILWVVGIMNAINLIDGLDGLATGISLFAVLMLFVLGVTKPSIIVALTAIALAGALTGFLRYNFNPASIFMGDSGSLFLGYVLGVTAISGSAKSSTVVSLLIPLLAMGLPVMDTLFAMARRFIAGRPIFSSDREHMHHKLLDLGLSHRQVVLVMYVACGLLALGALGLQYANSVQAAAILAAFGVAAVGISQAFGYVSLGEMSGRLRYGLRRRWGLTERLENTSAIAVRIREAESVDEVLALLVELAGAIDADALHCRMAVIAPEGHDRHELHWPKAAPPYSGPVVELVYPLDWVLEGVETSGSLSVRWHCEDQDLQVPEEGCYAWIAMVLRDRVLELALRRRAVPGGPRVAERPDS